MNENSKQSRWPVWGTIAGLVILLTVVVARLWTVPGVELYLFKVINGVDWGTIGTWIARIFSDSVWVTVFVVAGLLLAWGSRRQQIWRLSAIGGGSFVAAFVFGHLAGRLRPNELLEASDVVIRAIQDGHGMPSSHTSVIAGLVVGLWPFMNRWQRWLSALLVLGVGWARVYLGVHFPLDIVGGVAVGALVVAVLTVLPVRLKKILQLN